MLALEPSPDPDFKYGGGEELSTKGTAGRMTKWSFPGIVLFLPPAISFGLGGWQLLRRQEKVSLLEIRKERLKEDPIPLAEVIKNSQINDRQLEYRRVKCNGVMEKEKSIFLGPRAKSFFGVYEKGYYIITPLKSETEGNGKNLDVLVNRGWVPSGWKDEILEPSASPVEVSPLESSEKMSKVNVKRSWYSWLFGSANVESETKVETQIEKIKANETVSGVVRGSEIPNSFVPPNSPETGQWFFVDVPAMAKACGLSEDAVLMDLIQDDSEEDDDFEPGRKLPIPKDPGDLLKARVMPNDHLSYAATWFTLSLATGYLARKRLSAKSYRKQR